MIGLVGLADRFLDMYGYIQCLHAIPLQKKRSVIFGDMCAESGWGDTACLGDLRDRGISFRVDLDSLGILLDSGMMTHGRREREDIRSLVSIVSVYHSKLRCHYIQNPNC